MEIIWGCMVLVGVYMGYRMGKGDELKIDMRAMKKAVRSDEQEAELIEKIQKGKK